MFFGLTIEKLLLIGLVAGLLIGPERLPRYAESLTRFAKRAKEYISSAKTRVKDEMGSDFDDVDWRTLDPRQYDPRRIIREALLDDAPVPTVRAAGVAAAVSTVGAAAGPAAAGTAAFTGEEPPPFDSEAT
jgi:sec-independent protein translocase protein TatB